MRTLLIPLIVSIAFIISCCDASSTLDSGTPSLTIIDISPPSQDEDAGIPAPEDAGASEDAEVSDADSDADIDMGDLSVSD